jgi:hypothetical protein
MSLAQMMKTGLPMNRKERYFTGTVLPMIVCANGLRDLGVLATLIPGCTLPPIVADPRTANIQFFSEYSLAESIHGPATRARFPNPPKTKETPDIMFLVAGKPSVLVAIEAKMYDQPTAMELMTQMQAQRFQLDYLRDTLAIGSVHHAALLPAGLAARLRSQLPAPFPVIVWEDLLAAYRTVRGEDDYFLGMLALALEQWSILAAKPSVQGATADQKLTGAEILEHLDDPAVRTMSRNGGIGGMALQNDLPAGKWRKHHYEVSAAEEPVNGNWFLVEEFVAMLRRNGQV